MKSWCFSTQTNSISVHISCDVHVNDASAVPFICREQLPFEFTLGLC